ncbi:hypothetical protein PHMEG_00011132 [Phytophthora megakarya]|uniref:PiggyBac transposable element-derived protein domain-containing protein n=1 Tax=Phytophthora megakarya TaxID=4795 RepID=A0A225WE17_9STRA|nr:hypothetical protein PHMEG_00011132 [Phytophthora megakarya]
MARIRASKRGKTAAVATMARDIDFRHPWRQIRGAGWSSRRPRGIQTDWTYVSPDGVRTFVDTESKIDEVGAGENTEDGESGDAEQESDAAVEVVRPSQIYTSAQLSQRALDDLFGPESDSDAELSQAAVDRAFDVSASDHEAADSQRDPDANLQLLSEVSGAESEVNKDINFVSTDEDLSAYESYSSDESIDDAIVDRDDDIGSASEDDDIVSESNAAEMDEAFVEALHLGSGDASKNSMWQRSATLRGMAWMPVSGTFEEGVRPYPGLNMEEAQPVLELRSVCHSPMLTFFYVVPKSLRVMINEETNRYYKQRTEKHQSIVIGKRNANTSGDSKFDHKTGAAAVVRNLKAVLVTKPRHPWYLVVVDRFYSSVLLAIELLGMCIYVVGTIMTGRLGYDNHIKEPRKTRPAAIPRGSFLLSRSVAVPTMVAFDWWDRKPVQYLCTGSAMTASTIQRNMKLVGPETVPCPAAVNDYQRWMGGVDVHDQLHLQTFSLQMSTRFTKYYKDLFLGFIDLALVNSYITHKECETRRHHRNAMCGFWFCVLQNQLLQLKLEDFAGVVMTLPPTSQKRRGAPVRLSHALE